MECPTFYFWDVSKSDILFERRSRNLTAYYQNLDQPILQILNIFTGSSDDALFRNESEKLKILYLGNEYEFDISSDVDFEFQLGKDELYSGQGTANPDILVYDF